MQRKELLTNAIQYQGITAHDALVLFKTLGYTITMPGLLYMSKKEQLGKKINRHWVMFPEKIVEYVKKLQINIPEEWKDVQQLVKLFDLPNGQFIYRAVRLGKIRGMKVKRHGRQRTWFINEQDFREVFEKYRNRNLQEGKNE